MTNTVWVGGLGWWVRGGLLAFACLQLACSTEDAGPVADGGAVAGASGAGSGGAQAGSGGAGGTGGSTADAGDARMDADAGTELDSGMPAPASVSAKAVDEFVCPGGSIGPGNNTLMVNGRARTLVADFPQDPSAKMGILFSWHGYNQAEGSHHDASNLNPDGNPDLPLVVITPDDIEFELPVGLDWQLDEGSVEKNVDLQFFEAMVGCLDEQYDIDPERIHSLGYSAGSVMSSLLHSVYPHIVRVVVAISGMWFNDPAEVALIPLGPSVLKPTWPALRPEDGGTILLTHGGATDIAALIINLEQEAQLAFPFLKAANRVVVDCAHNNGHTGHPEIGPEMISKFLTENSVQGPSPYLTDPASYTGYPTSCMLRLP